MEVVTEQAVVVPIRDPDFVVKLNEHEAVLLKEIISRYDEKNFDLPSLRMDIRSLKRKLNL